MIKAVIFDMYETLITHFQCPLYFGAQMAVDAGIPEHKFQALWEPTEQVSLAAENQTFNKWKLRWIF